MKLKLIYPNFSWDFNSAQWFAKHSISISQPLLVAVSGGIDSMVLLHVLHTCGVNIIVAHCNFKLRAKESDDDEILVKAYCTQHNIPCYTTQFNTTDYCATYKLGTQEGARNLRYEWFTALQQQYNCAYVAVAHNANDQAETLLYKLSRGTGIKGLQGMLEITESIIRPLLTIERNEIEAYASKHNIPYRNDSSNSSDKYARNYIRHNVLPALHHVNSQVVKHLCNTSNYAQLNTAIVTESVSKLIPLITTQLSNSITSIDIKALQTHTQHYEAYLYYILEPYALNTTQYNNLLDAFNSNENGAKFETENYLLCVHNTSIHILAKTQLINVDCELNKREVLQLNESTQLITNVTKSGNYCDESTLTFPLRVRNWQQGDSIQPLGMNGKSKLVSDIFMDKKYSVLQKQQTLILISNKKIVFVLNTCTAHWARITADTEKIFSVEEVRC
jgi:tRNA(Ile)-lysidine synthase